jgi:magnesium-transporting ATPase (P-type)
LLWVAGTLAFISGTPELGWAIWAVIWINAGFSFWQEFQAEQALAALNKMLPAQAKVYRDGKLRENRYQLLDLWNLSLITRCVLQKPVISFLQVPLSPQGGD